MNANKARTLVALLSLLCLAGSAEAVPISKLVKEQCASDYHKYCDEYGLETTALRMCMNKAGQNLSKGCVDALLESGEVTQAEVDRRKQAGH
jgi:hypothetical protein